MKNKILAELEFGSIINEVQAQTQTGAELINKYKAFLMANESTFALVNNFIKEAQNCRYDNGVNYILERLSDYINQNKTSWALSTVCESINNNQKSYNYLNRNAARQVEKLLEMEEDDVVKYIKAGALKNVMYCESFRNIVKQIYKDQPVIEATADYVVTHPVSMIENVGDGYCFEVFGALYKMNEDQTILEAQWNEVSNTFKTISQLLESNICEIDSNTINVKAGNATYSISKAGKVVKNGKEGQLELTVEQLRENNRLVLCTANPRRRNEFAGILEAIALVAENYDNIVVLDNVGVYSTRNDKFMVIESNTNLYATLLQSNRHPKWTINENVIEAISFIKSKTNVQLNEVYGEQVNNAIEAMDAQDKLNIEEAFKDNKVNSYKERIEALTEKFKNDPVKLAVLSKLAQEVSEI